MLNFQIGIFHSIIQRSKKLYKVDLPTKERWIYIFFDIYDSEEPDSFINLLKEYRNHLGGNVKKVSKDDTQYVIDNDPYQLMFQWDSCFGITVVVPYKSNLKESYDFLVDFCNQLNNSSS